MNIIDDVISTEATRQNVRLMLPVLIHWAKSGHNAHTYGDLIHAIGKSKFSGIGHALYAVQEVLNALSSKSGNKDIPTLNSLCKNAKTMLPSEGFEFVSPKYNKLDEVGKRVFVEGLDSKACNYPHWDWVLDQLELKEATPFTVEQLEAIKSQVDIPVFANIRCNFSKKKVSPFVDVKGGTYVTNNGGLYVNASAGCRFAVNEKQAVSIAVGYASEKLEFETFDRFTSNTSMNYTRSPRKLDTEAITLKLGFEF